MTVDPVKVLYILATQRSGSTILGRVLGTHPGFTYGGELRRIWERGTGPGRTCGCGKAFASCPFWVPVLDQALEGVRSVEQMTAWQSAIAPSRRSSLHARRIIRAGSARSESNAGREYRAVMERLYEAVADVQKARVVIDTSKRPTEAVLLSAMTNVRPYFLHLVRDPRGFALSFLSRTPSERAHWMNAVRSSLFWTTRNSTARFLLARGTDPSMVLRYEDFVGSTAEALRAIIDFVTEPADEHVVAKTDFDLPLIHTAGGALPSETVRLQLDDRWRTELRSSDRILTTLLTARGLLRYRYPLRSPTRDLPSMSSP